MKIKTVFTITIAIMLSIPVLAQADNCCGIDRQCTTDKEWADGYHAYHNGQCQAPAQEQASSPSPPVSEGTSEIDNCCFIGWECHNDDDWKRGYNAYQNNQCGGNAITNTSIISFPPIEGSAAFRDKIVKAWDYLRDRSSKWFNYAISANFSVIQESWRSGVWLSSGSPKLDIESSRNHTGDIVVLSSIFVHEACHVYQWRDGRWGSLSTRQKESECYQKQAEAVSEYAPSSTSYIAELRCYAANPPHVSGFGRCR